MANTNVPTEACPANYIDLRHLIKKCHDNDWEEVLHLVADKPSLAECSIQIDMKGPRTCVLHEAISSNGDHRVRSMVISAVLRRTPKAARLPNGKNILPLHALLHPDCKLDLPLKDRLVRELVRAHSVALAMACGEENYTPLHLAMMANFSPTLVMFLIEECPSACCKKDKEGFLPVHLGCCRFSCPEKLRLLLEATPNALDKKTKSGHSLFDLAKNDARDGESNPLLDELKRFFGHTEYSSVSTADSASTKGVSVTEKAKPPPIIANAKSASCPGQLETTQAVTARKSPLNTKKVISPTRPIRSPVGEGPIGPNDLSRPHGSGVPPATNGTKKTPKSGPKDTTAEILTGVQPATKGKKTQKLGPKDTTAEMLTGVQPTTDGTKKTQKLGPKDTTAEMLTGVQPATNGKKTQKLGPKDTTAGMLTGVQPATNGKKTQKLGPKDTTAEMLTGVQPATNGIKKTQKPSPTDTAGNGAPPEKNTPEKWTHIMTRYLAITPPPPQVAPALKKRKAHGSVDGGPSKKKERRDSKLQTEELAGEKVATAAAV